MTYEQQNKTFLKDITNLDTFTLDNIVCFFQTQTDTRFALNIPFTTGRNSKHCSCDNTCFC